MLNFCVLSAKFAPDKRNIHEPCSRKVSGSIVNCCVYDAFDGGGHEKEEFFFKFEPLLQYSTFCIEKETTFENFRQKSEI